MNPWFSTDLSLYDNLFLLWFSKHETFKKSYLLELLALEPNQSLAELLNQTLDIDSFILS